MPTASVKGVDLYFETFGDEAGPPLLLVCGLGMQMVSWSQELFDAFVERGFYVVAYDNRDAGLSTHLVDNGVPNLLALLQGGDANIAYLLSDMADDAAGLLEAIGIESAHVMGVSMGGMISQQLAISHPEKVRSLCSVMSTTGDHTVGQPSAEAAEALLSLSGTTRDEVIESSVKAFHIIGSTGFAPDEERMRRMAAESFDRSSEPTGMSRQMGAVLASPDRTVALGGLSMPTLVIHGSVDPLIHPSGGKATADAVPGSKFLLIEGMGHDLPLEIWDQVVDAVTANASEVDAFLASPAVAGS